MTSIALSLSDELYKNLLSHLLSKPSGPEEAAFLFSDCRVESRKISLTVKEVFFVTADDFIHQSDAHLLLTDQARARIIKKAHDMNSCLIEAHSHPGPWPARFSAYDNEGLREIVPHMKWRLPNRPYVALVMARSGFDALVWLDKRDYPIALKAIVTPTMVIRPTNLSVRDWI